MIDKTKSLEHIQTDLQVIELRDQLTRERKVNRILSARNVELTLDCDHLRGILITYRKYFRKCVKLTAHIISRFGSIRSNGKRVKSRKLWGKKKLSHYDKLLEKMHEVGRHA